MRNLETLVIAKTIKGTSFVSVRNYLSQKNELANHTFLVGANYINALKKDLQNLLDFDLKTLSNTFDADTLNKALNSLITSTEKRLLTEEEKDKLRLENDSTIKRSDAQKNAYISLVNGSVKLNKETNDLYVYGFAIRKTILEKGVYKKVNSRQLTLAKKEITKKANLKQGKFRLFKVGSANEIRMQGFKI